MKNGLRFSLIGLILAFILSLGNTGCYGKTTETETVKAVQAQQQQYVIGQPIPVFDWSLERDQVIQLYMLRNETVATHTVWRSDYGLIEGHCSSIGYGIPYDTSLTNPLMSTGRDENGYRNSSLTSIEQPEPNGIFLSKNTPATWAMCVSQDGNYIEPHYIESKVTVYPYPITVDYETNRVIRAGKSESRININRKRSGVLKEEIP